MIPYGIRPGLPLPAPGAQRPAAGAPGAAAPAAASRAGELREVARQFEAIFAEMLLKHMRAAAQGLGAADQAGSLARDVYHGWFDQAVAQRVAAAGGLGLSDLLYRQLAVRYNGGNAPTQEGDSAIAEPR